MDKRAEEMKHIEIMVDFLCDEYPKLFEKGGYEHPVLGVRKTLTIIHNQTTFDIENIEEVLFDFENNRLILRTSSPRSIHSIVNFIKDDTVM